VNGYLVDTNIPSELTRLKPEPRVAAFLRQAAQERLYVSTLTFGEICHGIGKLRPEATAKRLSLQLWLDTVMRPWFAGRVLAVTAPIAERWGFLSAEAKNKGRTLPVIDGLIAATALEHELALVTRNEKHFVGLGVSLLNPWEAG
jgi:predicted nucleic acid-binding protein